MRKLIVAVASVAAAAGCIDWDEAIATCQDEKSRCVEAPVDRYSRALTLRPPRLRVGLPRHPFFDELDPEISVAIDPERPERAADGLGLQVRRIER